MQQQLVVDTLTDFAKQIGLEESDISSLNTVESEMLLKKMLACQTKDAGHFICSIMDPDDAQRIHVDTKGSIWNIGKTHPVSPKFYQYIFANASLDQKQLNNNESFQNFKNFIGLKDDRTAVRLFHALNLHNMFDEIKAVVKDPFLAHQIQSKMNTYLEEDEGGNRCVIQDDIASFWQDAVHFPFFSDKRVVLGKIESQVKEEPEPVVKRQTPLQTIPPVPVESSIQTNALLKRFKVLNDVPVTFPVDKIAKQLILTASTTDQERVEEDLSSLLHRDQSVDNLFSNKEALTKVAEHELQFKDIVKSAFGNDKTLHERINSCPECVLYASQCKPEETKAPANEFLASFLYDHWKNNTNVGKKWIHYITQAGFFI